MKKEVNVKTRTRGVTVKITALMPRDTWARVRAEAVRRGTTARYLLTEATEAMLSQWEKESKSNSPTTDGVLGLLARHPEGVPTALIHEAFPHTTKSDILTRLQRAGQIERVGPGKWAMKGLR